jgi:hypothetical protein
MLGDEEQATPCQVLVMFVLNLVTPAKQPAVSANCEAGEDEVALSQPNQPG